MGTLLQEISKKVFSEQKNNPNYWLNKSADLHASAKGLWDSMDGNTNLTVRCWSPYLMLCGMALETMFKAIIVADNRTPQPTHNLCLLSEAAGLNFDYQGNKVLKILSESIIWEGRYPVPKSDNYFYEYCEIVFSTDILKWSAIHSLWQRASELFHSKIDQHSSVASVPASEGTDLHSSQ